MTTRVDNEVTAEIMKMEEARCRALLEADWPALDAILHADYSHTHGNGLVQNKSEYREGRLKVGSQDVTRRDLSVRLFGNSAVMLGVQANKRPGPNGPVLLDHMAIQVWVDEGGWKLLAFQNTPMVD